MKLRGKLLNNWFVRWIHGMIVEEKIGLAIALLTAIGANIVIRMCLNSSPIHQAIKETIIFCSTVGIIVIGYFMFTLTVFIIEMLIERIIKQFNNRT